MFRTTRPLLLSLGSAGLCLALVAPAVAQAQKFPERPITIVNAFGAGGPSDTAARIIAQHMSGALGQPVVVESRPGGASMIAANYVAKQPADGYTLLLANNQIASNSLLYRKIAYKMTDFEPVGLAFKAVNAMLVPASLPVTNVREFVEYAKARPGELNYVIFGQGGSPHVNGMMLERAGGIKMAPVSYKGAADATSDLLGARVHAMFVTTSGAIGHHNAGRGRILAITGEQRLEGTPDLPTFKEQGYDVVSYTWFGLVAPAGTPQNRIELLNRAVVKAVQSAEFQEKMTAGGNIPSPTTPQEMAAFMAQDFKSWEAILKPLNLQLD